ncbi:ATP-binding protein [Richelia sinica]|nr:ATP-binding protein [Richelia sinica]MBD2667150.1 CBS domain-containing protein [Richelia sinica FACHB-800]
MLSTSAIETENLKLAVIKTPMIVSGDLLLSEAIALINGQVVKHTSSHQSDSSFQPSNNCLLVVDNTKHISIFTSRDIIHLIATNEKIPQIAIANFLTPAIITIQESDLTDIFPLIHRFHHYQIHNLPVINNHHQVVGLITSESLQQLLPQDLLQLQSVYQYMNHDVISAFPDASLFNIIQLMDQHHVSEVVIVEQRETFLYPLGVITENQILQLSTTDVDLHTITAASIMDHQVCSILPHESLWSALMVMQSRQRHQVVVINEQGQLSGIITFFHILKIFDSREIYHIATQLVQKVSQLEAEKLSLINKLQNNSLSSHNQASKLQLTPLDTPEIDIQTSLEQVVGCSSENFFPTAVKYIANLFKVRSVVIFRREGETVYSQGFWADGKLQSDLSMPLNITPCAHTINQGLFYCCEGLQAQYPEHPIFSKLGINCYLGIALEDIHGQSIGTVCILDNQPLSNLPKLTKIFKIFTRRISAELEKQQSMVALNQLNQELVEKVKQRTTALRDSEEQFRQLAENIHQVFWVYNPVKNKILYVSPAYTKIWRQSCEELYQDPVSFIKSVHPDDKANLITKLENVHEGYDTEYRLVHADQSIAWIRDQAFPILDENRQVYRIVGIAEDITKRKQAEIEIHKSLEQEKELNDLRARFVTMTSHEFRTPLAVISSSAGILKDFEHKLDYDKKQKHLNCIITYVEHTIQLLDDILLINKAETGNLSFNPQSLDLVKFCEQLVQEIQISSSHHTIIFTAKSKINAVMTMDKKLLRQILINLLSNAIKYSPQCNNVKFTLKINEKVAIFCIEDQGIGIPAAEIPHLCESFYRASNVENIGGTGLGLAIVAKCISLHQGKIKIRSQQGKGTIVKVYLPTQINTSN